MTLCGVPMPVLSGIIILLLLNFGKIVQCHDRECWQKKFYYKHPNLRKCEVCRICPPDVVKNKELLHLHLEKKCEHLKPLTDGRIPHCHSTNFEIPSCEKWKPRTGTFNCSMDYTVYSTCRLECPPHHKLSHSENVTCTSELKWNHPFPICIDNKRYHHHQPLSTGAIICLVLVAAALTPTITGIIVCKLRRKTPETIDIEQRCQAPVNQVGIKLTNAEKKIYKNNKKAPKWIVKRDSTVKVSAVNQSCRIQYLVCLKTRSKLRPEVGEVYTTIPGGPSQIVISDIKPSHHGCYSWIAGLADGTKQNGTFKMSVKEPTKTKAESSLSEASTQHTNENTSLTSEEELESDPENMQTVTCKDMAILISTDEGSLGSTLDAGKDSGFQCLMKNRQDVHALYTLLDRDEKDEEISWHVIATSNLLGYDEDFVNFLEYHLKGQLYKGPMSYILTLMRQQGTSVADLVNLLKQYTPSSDKAIGILEKYL